MWCLGSNTDQWYQNLEEWGLSIRFLQFSFLAGLRREKPSKRELSHHMPPQDTFLGSVDYGWSLELWVCDGYLTQVNLFNLQKTHLSGSWYVLWDWRSQRLSDGWNNRIRIWAPGLSTPKLVLMCPFSGWVAGWGANVWCAFWWAYFNPGNLGF